MNRETSSEVEFTDLLRECLDKARPLGKLQEHSEFRRRGISMCCWIMRSHHDTCYEAEDLFIDACLMMLKNSDKLTRDATPDAESFFNWFFTLALNIFRSRLRRHRLPLVFEPVEEFPIRDLSVDTEGEFFVREFLDFVAKTLPDKKRRAIELWLEGHSSRELQEALHREGIKCTHVTAQHWVNAGVEAFKKHLTRH